ncbi:hypothetical protein E4U21_001854 [Claviceps maximensis]|nr:hypothetical protein E4U21_001854 [Claviceps maximensis]
MYSWVAFVTGMVVSEIPYLVICAVLYFVWVSDELGARREATFFVLLTYEFFYTGIGEFIAAYAPNKVFAMLVNPLLLGVFISFCGVLVPCSLIKPSWRYCINPFNYLMGSMLVFDFWGSKVRCTADVLAIFDPRKGISCAGYLDSYLMLMNLMTKPIRVNPFRFYNYISLTCPRIKESRSSLVFLYISFILEKD